MHGRFNDAAILKDLTFPVNYEQTIIRLKLMIRSLHNNILNHFLSFIQSRLVTRITHNKYLAFVMLSSRLKLVI